MLGTLNIVCIFIALLFFLQTKVNRKRSTFPVQRFGVYLFLASCSFLLFSPKLLGVGFWRTQRMRARSFNRRSWSINSGSNHCLQHIRCPLSAGFIVIFISTHCSIVKQTSY